MDVPTIITNNIPRDYFSGCEIGDDHDVRREHDYLTDEEFDQHLFFRYKGHIYSMGEVMRLQVEEGSALEGWDGALAHGFSCGLVVKFCERNERIIVGRYRY